MVVVTSTSRDRLPTAYDFPDQTYEEPYELFRWHDEGVQATEGTVAKRRRMDPLKWVGGPPFKGSFWNCDDLCAGEVGGLSEPLPRFETETNTTIYRGPWFYQR